MCVCSESSAINLIWTKKLVLLYVDYKSDMFYSTAPRGTVVEYSTRNLRLGVRLSPLKKVNKIRRGEWSY
jgi:hypothetical protein